MSDRTKSGPFGLALAVLKFFVPGHLDGFELGFVGGGGVAGKVGELDDPFVHVREADGERIGVGIFIAQRDGDVFDSLPTEFWRHVGSSGEMPNSKLALRNSKTAVRATGF